MEKATFGAGCFWGVESFFRVVPGVMDAVSGFAGGELANPTYRRVCTDTTGHAEVVQVTYDPTKASYDRLLDMFARQSRSHHHEPAGAGFRLSIRLGDLHAEARAKVEALRKAGRFPPADLDHNRTVPEFLSRRRISSTLFRKERAFLLSCDLAGLG